jgi:hypothetical protein
MSGLSGKARKCARSPYRGVELRWRARGRARDFGKGGLGGGRGENCFEIEKKWIKGGCAPVRPGVQLGSYARISRIVPRSGRRAAAGAWRGVVVGTDKPCGRHEL